METINKNFSGLNYIGVDKKDTSPRVRATQLEELRFYKNTVAYENEGGSATSFLGEATLNYMVAKASKNVKDVVTYFLIEELGMAEKEDIKILCDNCIACVNEYKTYLSKKAKNPDMPKFESKYSNEVTIISKYITELMFDIEQGSYKAKKVYNADNKYLITPRDYLVYALSTERQHESIPSFSKKALNPNTAPQLRAFKEDYAIDNGKELVLYRVNSDRELMNKTQLNDAIIIDSEFSGSELPENFNVYSYFNTNSDALFLTNNNTNNCVLTHDTDTPVITIVYPKTTYNKETEKDVEINYQSQIELVKANIQKKYPNVKIEVSEKHIDNVASTYTKKKGQVNVSINSHNVADEKNQSNLPKDLINIIFQTERALNEVTIKDINKVLNLSEKQIVGKKGVKTKKSGVKAPEIKKGELNKKETLNKEIFKACNIKNHAELIQRAIALGATMNSLKLNGYLSPQATKASCLFLQSQFNKTIALLSNNYSLAIMPYINKKIAKSFEREVKALGLNKTQVIQKFKENGMPVKADETFTLQQIMAAKPDRTLTKEMVETKSKPKETVKEAEEVKETTTEASIETTEVDKSETKEELGEVEVSEETRKSMKQHEKLIKKLRKNQFYKKAKANIVNLRTEEKAKEEVKETEEVKAVEEKTDELTISPETRAKIAELGKKLKEFSYKDGFEVLKSGPAIYALSEELKEADKPAEVVETEVKAEEEIAEETVTETEKEEVTEEVADESSDKVKEISEAVKEARKRKREEAKLAEEKAREQRNQEDFQENILDKKEKWIKNIEMAIAKIVEEETDIIAEKLNQRINNLQDGSEKEDKAISAHFLSELFVCYYLNAMKGKNVAAQKRLEQISAKVSTTIRETIQKQAIEIADEYVEGTKGLAEIIWEAACAKKQEKPLEGFLDIYSALLEKYRIGIRKQILKEIQERYNVSLRISKPKQKEQGEE